MMAEDGQNLNEISKKTIFLHYWANNLKAPLRGRAPSIIGGN